MARKPHFPTRLWRVPTHFYDPDTGYLYVMAHLERTYPPIAGYYLRSERSRSGHEIAIFSREPPYALRKTSHCAYAHRTATHTCRFRFETGARIRFLTDDKPATVHYPKRRKEAYRIRIRCPQDIATWIYASQGTPQAWLKYLLRAFSEDIRLRDIPVTYDAATMLSIAQHAGNYVAPTACARYHFERTIGARNGYLRRTLRDNKLDTKEALQFVRAHRKMLPGRPIPLRAALPESLLRLPRPKRVLHTPIDRPMVTLATSLPATMRVPLEWAIHRWTNDTIDRWLAYLLMWAHSPKNKVPIRVACRLCAVLEGRPWPEIFTEAHHSTGIVNPYALMIGGKDDALWAAILDPGERDYVP